MLLHTSVDLWVAKLEHFVEVLEDGPGVEVHELLPEEGVHAVHVARMGPV